MSVRLKVEHGQDAGRVWRLKEAGAYVVGRDATSAIRVLDMKVSKGHCEILVEEGANGLARIRDLKSTHGTQLNGQPVKSEATLKAGDEVRVGFTVLRVLSDGPADALVAPNGPLPAREAAAPPAGAGPVTTNGGGAAGPAAGAPAPATGSTPSVEPGKVLPPDELVGKTLGGYRVIQKIGQGGMGAVYLAEQVSLKREVAFKVLSEKFVADSAFVDQFLNEARAAGALNHPNVVQVYDVGQADGRYFFSMEYVPGGAIEDKIKGGSAPWNEALNWFLDAANALLFAQKRGILHRDVKPDNLMLAEDGSAKLCDLGLAKKSESSDLLAQGIIGTPHFISPEAIRRKGEIDHRTDLYSLGCTFYRILTGENPYPAKTVKDILLAHLNKPVPKVADKKPDVPKELSDVVLKLMQKEPADRFASADELYTALDKIRLQHGLAAHGIRPGGKKPLVIAAIVGVLALAAVAWAVTRPEKQREKTPDEIAAEAKAEQDRLDAIKRAQEGERSSFVSNAQSQQAQLAADVAKADVERTWADAALWEGFGRRIDELVEKLKGDAKFGSDPEVVVVLTKLADEKAKIEGDRTYQRTTADQRAQAVEAYKKDVETTCEGIKRQVEDALKPVEGQVTPWWTAARFVTKEETRKVLDPLQARAKASVAGREIRLMEPEALSTRIKQLLPGEDWPGQNLFKQTLERGQQLHAAEMARLEDALAKIPADDLTGAEDLFGDYVERLPEPPASDLDPVSELLRTQRGAAIKRQREVLRERGEVVRRNERLDLSDLLKLVRRLREPEVGTLWRFSFPSADDEVQRYALGMRDPRFKRLGRQLLADARAYNALFDHLQATFKTWTDVDFEGDDGKRQKIVEVQPDGLACPAKTKVAWTDLGHARLLARVFYAKGEAPRFPFAPEDLRGLAVLAEIAGEGGQAQKHWTLYKASLTAEQAEEAGWVDERLAGLDREMQAARLFRDVKLHAKALSDFQEKHALPSDWVEGDPLRPRPTLTAGQRDAIQRERGSLEKHVAELGMALRELSDSEEAASTLWGISVRTEMHPKAKVVRGQQGEPPPGPPPVAPAAPAKQPGAPPDGPR